MEEQQMDMNAEAEQAGEEKKTLMERLGELRYQLPSLALLAMTFVSTVADPSGSGGVDHRG